MDSVILIGMPGAGKSTVGVLLAKALGLDFVDTDLIIQRREGRTLQAIIDADGLDSFILTEDRIGETEHFGIRRDDMRIRVKAHSCRIFRAKLVNL